MNNALLPARARRTGISLTALIDVVFILLMFFMLTTSFTTWRAVNLHAPLAANEAAIDDPQWLLLRENGALYLHGGDFHLANHRDLHTASLQGLDPARSVVLLPAADASVQAIISTLEALQLRGMSRVTLGNIVTSKAAR